MLQPTDKALNAELFEMLTHCNQLLNSTHAYLMYVPNETNLDARIFSFPPTFDTSLEVSFWAYKFCAMFLSKKIPTCLYFIKRKF